MMATEQTGTPLMRLSGITKAFGGVPVLKQVGIEIRAGSIHALIGANGAGKSTLGKIVGGYYRRDDGEIRLDGDIIDNWTPDRALAAGIAMIHQEIQLVPGLSVADNVFLGNEERGRLGLCGDNQARYRALEAEVGFGIPGRAIAGTLPLHVQQKVEILRALARRARIIVMDEPTAALSADEAEKLHHVMLDLKRRGCAILYVTHFLDHVLTYCDQVTVMREGRVTGDRPLAGMDRPGLVEMMLGGSFTATFPALPPVAADAPVVLDVRNLSAGRAVADVSFTVRRGEVVGLAGLVGSGRTEILRAIGGADPVDGGSVHFDGDDITGLDLRATIARGLVMVPEDRRGQGLVMSATVAANMTLPYLARVSRLGFVDRAAERERVLPFMDSFGIVPSDPDVSITGHSGGNQQKVLLARWLLDNPGLIMLDEPTRGVDIGARQKIYDAIARMAADGMAVLLVSSDLEEVLGLSHRAILIQDGRDGGEAIDPARWTPDSVLRRLFNVDHTATEA